MRRMGGLRGKLPVTFWTFVVGGLALAAIVPFAGFWSKDGVLSAVWQRATQDGGFTGSGWYVLYASGLVTAGLTGFYTFKMIFSVFLGTYRGGVVTAGQDGHGVGAHAELEPGLPAEHAAAAPAARARGAGQRGPLAGLHEVGLVMTIPMVILAVLSFAGGFYGTPWKDLIGGLLAPVTGVPVGLPVGSATMWISMALSLACALLGIAIAWTGYGARQPRFAPSRNPLVAFLANRWYVDAIYDRAIVRPIIWISGLASGAIEGGALDGGSRGLAWAFGRTSRGLRTLQTGYVRNYALGILLGAAALLLYFVIFVIRVGG
jgi:NADH-quinone oxidoreductase subunit L